MARQASAQSKSDFWISWGIANWVASLGARWILNAFQTYDQVSGKHIPAPFDGILAGVTIGFVAACLQWLMLRRQVYNTGRWASATFIGWTIGMTAAWPVQKSMPGAAGELAALALAGFTIGILQWLLLSAHVYRAGWWILASSIGWIAGEFIVGWIAAGFAYLWLYQRPKGALPPPPSTAHHASANARPAIHRATPSRARQDLILIVKWIGLSVIGQFAFLFVSGIVALALVLFWQSPILRALCVAAGWLAAGGVIGIMQGVVLQRPMGRTRQWIVLTTCAWGLAGTVMALLTPTIQAPDSALLNPIIAGALIGLLVGTAQWQVLRQCVQHAAWWIPANAIGGVMGLVSGSPILGLLTIAIGVATAPLLVWLLHQRLQPDDTTRSIPASDQ